MSTWIPANTMLRGIFTVLCAICKKIYHINIYEKSISKIVSRTYIFWLRLYFNRHFESEALDSCKKLRNPYDDFL